MPNGIEQPNNPILKAVIFLVLIFSQHTADAQFWNGPINKILEETRWEAFSHHYIENKDDYRQGGSSLQVIEESAHTGVTGGYFVDRPVTVTFEYKYNRDNRFDNVDESLEILYDSPTGLKELSLPDTNNLWCTKSFYLSFDPMFVQWSILFAAGSNSEVLFDNFNIEPTNNVQPESCSDSANNNGQGSNLPSNGFTPALSGIIGLLLNEDDGDQGEPAIYGYVLLPEGLLAPVGGVTVEIQTFPLDFDFSSPFIETSQIEVTIPEGASSIPYELPFLVEGDAVTREIQYKCLSGCTALDLATGGFWSTVTGTTDFFGASDFDVNTRTEVPIALEPGTRYTGTISFPNGFLASGGEQIVVTVTEVVSGFGIPESFSFFYYPESGDNEIIFDVAAPTDSTSELWRIEIQCNSCDSGLVGDPTYITNIGAAPLTTSSNLAAVWIKEFDLTGFDVELLLGAP
ncbi:hypothetical protein [Arenicella xantha]|uniref:Uncharacterized protein n=1 Tax=Arenicella xantha TaxID=644221 RepID=A0A395JLU2_9GAMM|nr:hypothetical protein [Arenicella xantha]RBP51732.1 hypothetical protein DFR28_1021165 [Arenicella xantha]